MLQNLFAMLGLKPENAAGAIVGAILGSINRISDRKARLAAVEVAALMAAQCNRAVLDAVEGIADETASKVKDALLISNMQTLGLLAKIVDIDGSLELGKPEGK